MNNNDKQTIRVGILKHDFDDMITDFGKNRASLRSNETLDVKDISLDHDIVVIKAELSENTVQ